MRSCLSCGAALVRKRIGVGGSWERWESMPQFQQRRQCGQNCRSRARRGVWLGPNDPGTTNAVINYRRAGFTFGQIGLRLKITRGRVAGIVHRAKM